MKLDYAVKTRMRFRTIIKDIFSTAKLCHYSGDRLNALLVSKVYNCLPKGTPNHTKNYLQGYIDALNENLLKENAVYGGYVDGKFYSSDSSRCDYYGKNGISASEFVVGEIVINKGLYWADDTSKIF